MFNTWILWMNSRNLQYIRRFNPKKVIRLADNKQKTKNFLKERWIPVPETYWVISDRSQLYNFDFSKIASKNFVVKPNKWSKWKWIYIVKLQDNIEDKSNVIVDDPSFFKRAFWVWKKSKFNCFYKTWWEIIDDDIFRRYLMDILDWRYSITFWQDKILVEEMLNPWINFKRYCKYWLADIRVIVFNLIPVAAMIRVPTAESWGKANIAQWWVWLWVEVGSGKIKSMYFKKQIFTNSFPWQYKELYNKKAPFWNDILSLSSKVQYFVNLWYLALDWVVTDDWPKLLEINARAWLEVQSAGALRLRSRLEKISDISVSEPEKWVEISKSLFNTSRSNLITTSKILYLSQKWSLIFEWEEEDSYESVIIRVDLKKDKNYISKSLYNKIKDFNKWDIILDIPENEIRFKNLWFECSEKLENNEIILWQWPINEYYIKPIHKIQTDINIIDPENINEDEIETLHMLDQNISKISKKLNFSKILKPVNYLDELDSFVTWNWNYNPKFIYDWPDNDKLTEYEDHLLSMKEKYFWDNFWLKSNFAQLFDEKIDELLNRIWLVRAYKFEKYQDIYKYNELLFWAIDKDLVKLSKEKVFIEPISDINLLGKKLSFSQVKKTIKRYLEQKWVSWVKFNTSMWLSRMAVIKSKNPEIRISSAASFREKELLATLAHEIDIHLIRFMNWRKTGWEILKSGAGYYIKDEEWLAVYNSFKYLPEWYEKKAMYEKYYLVDAAANHWFSRLVDIIKWIQPRTLAWAFKTALRLKKWIQNTWFVDKWAINMKDKIYLDGYLKIKDWIEQWWDLDKFMVWKIKTEDIDKIH